MKCHYQDCNCRYVNTSGMTQDKPCEECELYDKHRVRVSRGCAEPTSCGVVIIIILIIILL